MPDNKRKTRREVQAELKAKNNLGTEEVTSEVPSSKKRNRKNSEVAGKPKRNILAPLFLIEAVLILILYKFIGLGLVALVALIPFIYFILTRNKAKKGLKRPKGSLAVFIIYLLIIIFGIKTNGVLSSLVSTSQTNEFYVMAMKDDEVDKLEQIEAGSTIALGSETSYNTNVFPQAKFEEEGFDFNYTTYESASDSANALLDGTERFIVVENPKSDELKAIENFKSSTKVIGHYKEKVEIKGSSTNVTKQTFTVLLTGVDTRTNSIDSNARSDSIMVAKVNPKTAEATIISIPRDAYVLSSCTGQYDKITHSSLNGMNCLIDDVESLLGVSIDYYLTVNFFAVIDAIDAVGGIDITIDPSIYGDTAEYCGQDENDNLNAYCFTPGEMHLSGAEALSYARERHSFADGDYSRAKHQQDVINAFLHSLMTSGPFAINSLLDVASSSARTNLTASQLTDLAKLLQKSDDFTIDSYTIQGYGMSADLPYWGLYGTSVQQLDESSVAEAESKLAAIE